jgi:hypothetical protein
LNNYSKKELNLISLTSLIFDMDDFLEEKDEEEEKKADVKLGEFELRADSVLVIKKTNWKGDDRVDFRVWKNSPRYKGPTKQGFVLPMEKVDDFIKMVEGMKKKLKNVPKSED